jgi:hypothetical protein
MDIMEPYVLQGAKAASLVGPTYCTARQGSADLPACLHPCTRMVSGLIEKRIKP